MSWRDRVAKMLAQGVPVRTDLPTPAYHGSNTGFSRFMRTPVDDVNLDRGLGIHAAKDPALASSFADRAMTKMSDEVAPQVYPIAIPGEDKFLQVRQPIMPNYTRNTELPMWQRVAMDERAIERMMAESAFRQDQDVFARYLVEARAMKPRTAERAASEMVKGGTVPMEGANYNLDRFIKNFGGRPYNYQDRKAVTELSRQDWEDQGYKGLRYINTSPTEAGAKGVVDPTSYVVFDPANIRSQFAKFGTTPRSLSTNDLLAGVAGMAAVPAGIGALVDQSTYGDRQ